MIISHKYKFIFIKTRKTAGTSIELYLSDYCGKDDILTPISDAIPTHNPRNYMGILRKKFYNHISASEIKKKVSKDTWFNYLKFCVERNPWDKAISYYYFIRNRYSYNSFNAYLSGEKHCLNHPLYMDKYNDKIIVDRIIRYNTLNKELSEIFAFLGIPFNGKLKIYAKSTQRKDKRSYREIYTKEQANKINEIYKKEIDLHGWKF